MMQGAYVDEFSVTTTAFQSNESGYPIYNITIEFRDMVRVIEQFSCPNDMESVIFLPIEKALIPPYIVGSKHYLAWDVPKTLTGQIHQITGELINEQKGETI